MRADGLTGNDMFLVLKAMVKRNGIEMSRYYFNTIMALLSAYLFFFMLFMGAWVSGGASARFGDTLGGLVIGFMIWLLAWLMFTDLAGVLRGEAAQGTLEQLAMSPTGLTWTMVLRSYALLVYQVVIVLAFLLLMMATTGKWLHLDVVSIVPLMLITIAPAQGIGLIMGGLALVFKQIQSVFGLLQFVFIALIVVPVDKAPFLRFLPLSWGVDLLGKVMMQKMSIFDFSAKTMIGVTLLSAAYFAAGIIVFKMCELQARKKGLFGHY